MSRLPRRVSFIAEIPDELEVVGAVVHAKVRVREADQTIYPTRFAVEQFVDVVVGAATAAAPRREPQQREG